MYARNEHGRYLAYQTAPPPTAVPAPSNVFRSAEERGAVRPSSRQRMSLLHPPPQPPGDYNIPLASAPLTPRQDRPPQQAGPHYGGDGGMIKLIPPLSESPPCKKPRLGDSKPDIHMPLRIDTDRARSGPAYNPQVEAISPTLPSESIRDESPLKSTKEDLLAQIARVDREIAKTESQIAKLKKKKIELEEAATQPQKDTEEISNASDSVIQSLPQSIYAENRKKAAEAHQGLMKLGPHNDLPLYNQPSDTPVYQENSIKYSDFKSKLVEHFKAKQKEKEKRDTYLTKTYAQLSIEWARTVERLENSPKKKAQEAKKREMFEKVFPELRKAREDKERFSRVSRIKSDADLEEIMDGLHEQEMEDKKMRSYAVIPPALLDAKTRSRRFINRNGLIEDPMQEYKDKQLLNLWTDQEKDTFKEKYLQHPKNFGVIKSYLDRKCVSDCVQYYYLSKKTQNYRQLLRKSRARPRTRNSNQQQNNNNNNNNNNNANSNASANSSQVLSSGVVVASGKSDTNGVTTRQQKEQKTDPQGVSSSITCSPNQGNNNTSNEGSISIMGNPPSSSPSVVISLNNDENSIVTQSTASSEYSGQPRKKRKEDAKDSLMNEMDTSEEETLDLNGDKGGPHTCVCCKTLLESYMQSRPISRSQATQYGLNECDIQSSDRVCVSCRCKSVRRRFKATQCPIPTCPAKRARIKRLRPFPAKWTEICESRRTAIIAKYQIPANATKCCTACFNRINRRLGPNANLETPDDPGCDTTRWTDEEIEWMKKGLAEIGTDWIKLSERINTKSELQCRNFYFNYRKKYGLDALVQEHKKSKGSDGPPTLTDEEESGSTTSSCDETGSAPHDQPRPSIEKKQDDYDSSATVSAEEGTVEPEKSHSVDEMKTLPNNPESPLSLTIRSTNVPPQNSFVSAQKQIPLNVSHVTSAHHGGHHQSSSPSGPPPQQQGGPVSVARHSTPHSSMLHHHPQMNSQNPHHFAAQNFSHGQVQITHQGITQQQLSSVPHHMSPHQVRRYASPDNSDNHEPMTVKVNDLLQATIERQLRRNPAASNASNAPGSMHPGPSVSPTITSILKSQDRSHLPPPGSQQIMTQIHQTHPNMQQEQSQPHSQVPVQSNMYQQQQHQQHPSYYGPTKVEIRMQPHHIVSHEGLSLVQVPARDECGTLDLSMKKRPPSPHMTSQRPPSNGPPPAHQPLDFTPRQVQNDYYPNKFTNIRNRPSQLPPPPVKPSKPPPPLLTKPPTLSPMKDGSITHGTPMHHPQSLPTKYEGLLRPSKEGSITQGTPVDKMRGKDSVPTQYMTYDRSAEYYKRMSPAAPYFHGSPSPYYGQRPPSSGQRNSPPTGPPPPSAYAADQHNSSRQIIINDYYTSQQMQQPVVSHAPHMSQNSIGQQQPRMDPPKRNNVPANMPVPGGNPVYAMPPRQEIPYRQSPSPSCPPHQQQRQGVIHRANANRMIVKVEPPPGRIQDDAFATLVHAAASAPSLPVPKEEPRNRVSLPRVDMVREGLGKSMAEMERSRMGPNQGHPQMYRSPMNMPTQVGPPIEAVRIERIRMDAEVPRGYVREPQDSTLTAASLIDAIITHQINQPSPNDRQSPAPTSKSDRLFASFQRPQLSNVQQQQQQQQQQQPVSMHNSTHPGSNTQSNMHIEDNKMEEMRGMNHKTPQGGTWGEHINLIISNDYALGKGSSGIPASHAQVQQQPPPSSMMQQQQSSPVKKEGDQHIYRSWKLRLALQREREQLQKENHPDERHIIRVAQNEDRPSSRPPSHPTSLHESSEHGTEETSDSGIASNTTSSIGNSNSGPSGSSELLFRKTGAKETMSPLDYVKNLIMVKMRNENIDEKAEDEKSKSNHEGNVSVQGNHSSSSSGHQGVQGNSNQSNHISIFSGNSGNNSSMMDDRSSSSTDPQRYSNISQGEKKDEDSRKIPEESDSPASMIIDESAEDVKEKCGSTVTNEATSTVTSNQPNYEPLTDEET